MKWDPNRRWEQNRKSTWPGDVMVGLVIAGGVFLWMGYWVIKFHTQGG